MTVTSPVVSVVIPARDAAATLGEQLLALCPQVEAVRGEVVVADNGSRDATPDVVARAARRWPVVRLVDASSGHGPGGARNVGVAAARAPVVAFCDADDVVSGGWLAALLSAAQDGRLVAGPLDRERLGGGQSWQQQVDGLMRNPIMPGLYCAGAGNLALRRVDFLALGGFVAELRAGEDVDLCWRAQLAGLEMALAESAVVHVRARSSLRGLYRQMYGWGTGSRVLEQRYAVLRAAGLGDGPDGAPEAPAVDEGSGGEAPLPVSARKTLVRRAARLLTTSGRADAASALAERRGRARGDFGTPVPVLTLADVAAARERVRRAHAEDDGAPPA
ncbi:glycosyltransferase [Cellulosimicrobium marinum]|uniref:glycosyltransferase n=1 Tax=Cellulosimicrobium marinum TaxID=1638992 RepID=UPI001E47FF74|nr:glycosyltransferase [Cellulosimicrobium marinum]MCB7137041.1 glycosyltransferase [Cellulosimicrobium marinum]